MSDRSRCELYVYYRVTQADAQAALQTVIAFQRRLRQLHPGLATRVLQRSSERSDGVTLMEIYAFDNGRHRGIDPALQSCIEEAAVVLTPMLSSPRQIEIFDALD